MANNLSNSSRNNPYIHHNNTHAHSLQAPVVRGMSGALQELLNPSQLPDQPTSRNYTLSPETTDCDSADLESEVSVNEGSFHSSSGPRMQTAMPVLEDGLSSGHASDLEEDVVYSR